MKEIGEQLRSLREAKGMTQQDLADILYVTRQTVSRWECGSRYPDVITAKKIATVLEVTMDELFGNIEIKKDIEKEPVLNKSSDNLIQIVLYTITMLIFGLMSFWGLYDILTISNSLANTPAGQISVQNIFVLITYFVKGIISALGLILSIKKKLSPKIIGIVMSIPYIFDVLHFLVTFIDMNIKNNGYMGISAWIIDFIVPLVFLICILLFFVRDNNILFFLMFIIGIVTISECCYCFYHHLIYGGNIGFVIGTIHVIGKMGFVLLLVYQAYRLWEKRKAGYK